MHEPGSDAIHETVAEQLDGLEARLRLLRGLLGAA